MSKLRKFEVSFKDIEKQSIKLTKLAKKRVTIKKVIDELENLSYTDSQLEETVDILSFLLEKMEDEYKDNEEIKSYFKTNSNFNDFDVMKKWLNDLFDKLIKNVYVMATYREDEEKRRKDYKVLLKGFRLIADVLENANLDHIQMIDILATIAALNGVCVSGWKEAVVEILTKLEKDALQILTKFEKTSNNEYEEDPMKRVLNRTFWNARISVAKELAYNYMDEKDVPVSYRPHYREVFYRYLNKVYKLNLPIMDLSDKLLTRTEKFEIALKFGAGNWFSNISIQNMIYDRAASMFNDELNIEGNKYEILSGWGSSYFRRNDLGKYITDNVEFLTEYVLNEDMTKVRNIAIKEIMKDCGYISEKKVRGFFKKNNAETYQKRLILALDDIKTPNEEESLREYIFNESTDCEKIVNSAVESGYYDIFDYIKNLQPDRLNTKMMKRIKKNAWFGAIKRGNISDINKMLKLGIDVNECDKNKCSAIYLACCYGKYDVVEFLIKNGAKINIESRYRRTPLYIACKNKHYDIIKLLLNNKARIISRRVAFMYDNLEMYKMLHMACEKRYLELVEQLVDSKMNLNFQSYYFRRRTILHEMVEKGDLEIVNMLIEGGATVNTQDETLKTPLHIACSRDDVDMVKRLLRAHADVNILDDELRTPLHCACETGNLDIVNLLIGRHAKINVANRKGVTPIYIATSIGNLKIVEKLLDNGANLKSRYNDSILFKACDKGYLDIARALQKKGAAANNRQSEVLAYYEATRYKNMDILNILIDAGVNLNVKDVGGGTALYRVCQQEDIKTLRVLLKSNKIDINIKCGKGKKTALDVANERGSIYIQEMLKRHQRRVKGAVDIEKMKLEHIGPSI